jgi:hypothetical protein
MYQGGPVASPTQQNSSSALSSPLYPWMRSQFGMSYKISYLALNKVYLNS